MSEFPTYPWNGAPDGLATLRQLAAAGLRPNGSPVVAQIVRPRRHGRDDLTGYLYDVSAAAPKRVPTEGNLRAVAAMNAALATCRTCQTRSDYRLPASRTCLACMKKECLA
jgi:hypothetical protein